MSRRSWLLFTSIAVAPMTASPIGLGDIHVESELNQPLTAHIDIVGATPEDLAALSAAVANRDAFLRAGAERPAFLSSLTFKVTHDSDGRAILAVRSSDAFTDPLVSLLVDLRWPRGELIREYTLLLDPADASFRDRLAAATHSAAPAEAATVAARSSALAASAAARTASPAARREHHSLQARAAAPANLDAAAHRRMLANTSLRRLARRAGAHGRTDTHRMMLAIYRANPEAFDGSITRLRRGSTLLIPTREEAATLPRPVAEREYQAQLRAARNPGMSREAANATNASSPVPQIPPRAPDGAIVPAAAANEYSTAPTPTTAMDNRVRSLEQSIDELKSMLADEHAKFVWLQEQAMARVTPRAQAPRPSLPAAVTPIAAVLSFLLGLAAALRWRRGRDTEAAAADVQPTPVRLSPPPPGFAAETSAEVPKAPVATAFVRTDPVVAKVTPRPSPPVHGISVIEDTAIDELAALLPDDPSPSDMAADTTVETPPPKPIREATFVYGGETTAVLALDPEELFDETIVGMENVKLDYNLTDLDTTAQHVHLPSGLNDTVKAEEHRTNIIDVLKVAIDRDPHRRDLQMKLLEVYFSQQNKDAFMSLAEKLAQHREQLTSIDWQKVLMMGRQIAPDEALFKGDGKPSTYAA